MPSNDERFMLPPDLWAKGEDYLWYCVGKEEATLQMRYMRGAGGDRPYSICHYENVKIRAAMAELAANGGAPMARYANFNDPASRRELARFFRFMKQHDDVYHASTMAGEAVLLHPRSQLQQGRFTDALSAFHSVGDELLKDHILFDVLPDDMATPERLARYKRVFTISSMPEMGTETYAGLSRFEAPASVRVSASHPAKGGIWDIHFVNYDRKEPAGKEKTGLIADENPIAVSGVKADLVSPSGYSIDKVEWMTPESGESKELRVEQSGGRGRFTTPGFLVYAVARVHLAAGGARAGNQQRAALAGPARRAARPASPGGPPAASRSGSAAGCDPTACGHVPPGMPVKIASSVTENYAGDVRAARMPGPGAHRR